MQVKRQRRHVTGAHLGRHGERDRRRFRLLAAGAAALAVAGGGIASASTAAFDSLKVGDTTSRGQVLADDQFLKPFGDRLLFNQGKFLSSTISPDGTHLAALTTDQGIALTIVNLDDYKVQQTVGTASSADLKISSTDVGQEGPTYSPDGKFLWMPQINGYDRFPVNADGTVGAPTFLGLPSGTKYGEPTITDDADLGQKVATFDGVDDALSYALDGSKMTNGFTVECKVRFDAPLSSTSDFLCDNAQGAGVNLEISGGTRFRFEAWIGGGYKTLFAPQQPVLHRWYDVAATWDGSTMRLYIDGQPAAQTAATGAYKPATGGTARLVLGGSDDAPVITSRFYTISAAAARVYSRALTDQQVADLYADGTGADTALPGDLLNIDFNNADTLPPTFPAPSPADGAGGVISALPAQAVFSPDGSTVYAAINAQNRVVAMNAATGVITQSWDVGNAPRDLVMVGDKLYVSNEGGRRATAGDTTIPSFGTPIVADPSTGAATTGTLSVIDTAAPSSPVRTIDVGLHPTALHVAKGAVFVTDTGSDDVSVIDTATNKVVQTIATRPWPSAEVGYEPDGVTLTDDGHLLVTLGRANAVAVYRYTTPQTPVSYIGLLPTDYFPENVATVGDQVIITNLRGIDDRSGQSTIDMGPGTSPATGRNTHDTTGSLTRFQLPDDAAIRESTATVIAQNGWGNADVKKAEGTPPNAVPVPKRLGDPSTIKYVFLIDKENRTYDQVLGDDPRGNGDPSLTQFGENVTPNQHKMARQFGLYDNFYDIGTNSAEGHSWLIEADNPEYEESEAGEYQRSYSPYADALTAQRSGFIWTRAKEARKTARDFGETILTPAIESPGSTWPNLYCDTKNMDATGQDTAYPVHVGSPIPSLNAIVDPAYNPADHNFPDLWRYEIWKRDFEKNGPANLNLMWLPNDHTGGAPVNPIAQVADNDLALGKIVDTISHSKYWKNSAIFVVEDDTQNGVDHVDGTRGPVQIISPWAQHNAVDSHYYTQLTMVRTIEQILGIQPMNQKDSAATPMYGAFTSKPDYTPYDAVPNRIPLTYGLTTPPPCGYDQVPAKYSSLAPAQAPAAMPANERHVAAAWNAWAKKQPWTGPNTRVDSAPPALMDHYTWYQAHGWTKPYPGENKILTPEQVPGAYIPSPDDGD